MSVPILPFAVRKGGKWLLLSSIAILPCVFCPAQSITLRGKGVAIRTVLEKIQQLGYSYNALAGVLEGAPPVDLNLKNASVSQALDSCLAVLRIGYRIKGRTIFLFRKKGPDQPPSSPPKDQVLDEAVVQAYGRTTQRLVTGSVTPVSGREIESSPAGNVPEALSCRVPGLVVRQNNGVPGSALNLSIRGRRSIALGTNPLIVIDGVPLVDNDGYLFAIGSGSAQGAVGADVFNGIPPSAIASIEVLKDAAATAIYGSRGANGVLLLTLRTGSAGKAKWQADVSSGADRVTGVSPLLNTSQYLGLRKEAVENDNEKADATTVPEQYLWDSNRYTNFQRLATGNAGWRRNARVDVSGGDSNTVYILSGSYHGETAVFPGSTADDRMSLFADLHHHSKNGRLRIDVSGIYSWENNRLPVQDYSLYQWLAPNAPAFSNAAGQPVWSNNGLSYVNIPALGNNSYGASVENEFNHLQVSYTLAKGLVVRTSLGYYRIRSSEHSQQLIAGQDPATNPTGSTTVTDNNGHSELVEEVAEYSRAIGANGKLEALLGGDWQEQRALGASQAATGYTSDLLLASGGGAATITQSINKVAYRYEALFGRLNYILRNRYIVALSGRRDGSSRFGPGNAFGNFWAASAAWVFSEERSFHQSGWLSYGKVRGSLGTTGNDQLGRTSYEQVYSGTSAARGYQGAQGFIPTTLASNNLDWEVNYNSEVALDLGFLQNKILLSVAAYRDWTVNQLVKISLASQAGMPGVFSNVPANVVNKGLEFSLQTFNWTSRNFRWVSKITLTVPVNRLARFPSLANTSYGNTLVVGKSLTVLQGYHYEGVSADSGLFQFRDVHHNGVYDVSAGGNLDLRYYGGICQSFRYKNVELELFFEFRGQSGYNPFVVLYQQYPPGFLALSMLGNGPVELLKRWHQPGDHTRLQQVTETTNSVAWQRMQDYVASEAQSIDASFVRWKGLSVSYQLPAKVCSSLSLTEAKVYMSGQNLLTYTHFPVTDPETQDPTVLPPVRRPNGRHPGQFLNFEDETVCLFIADPGRIYGSKPDLLVPQIGGGAEPAGRTGCGRDLLQRYERRRRHHRAVYPDHEQPPVVAERRTEPVWRAEQR